MSLLGKISQYTETLNQQGLLRARRLSQTGLVHFDSNDYLSLAENRTVAGFYQEAYRKYPVGSTGSMLLNGYHANHHALEKAFADWLQVDECVLFSSGYAANLAITAILGELKTHCFIDKSVHASIYDGLRLAQVDYTRYVHNDLVSLQKKISYPIDNAILITEGIFSMSGQVAPLADIYALSKLPCVIDEAHALGVIGSEGKGAVALHGLTQEEVPLRMLAFGKAFGSQGALVAGKKEWISALLQAGRSGIYSTAISPALSYGLLKTLDVVIAADESRKYLQYLIAHFRQLIAKSSLSWTDSITPIQQLQLGCSHLAMDYAARLRILGFSCAPVRPPTVTPKATGLRVIVNVQHTTQQIDQLFTALESIYATSSN